MIGVAGLEFNVPHGWKIQKRNPLQRPQESWLSGRRHYFDSQRQRIHGSCADHARRTGPSGDVPVSVLGLPQRC